jgi:hypothetical protein
MSRSVQGHQARHRGPKNEILADLYSKDSLVCIIGQACIIRVEFKRIMKSFFAWL